MERRPTPACSAWVNVDEGLAEWFGRGVLIILYAVLLSMDGEYCGRVEAAKPRVRPFPASGS